MYLSNHYLDHLRYSRLFLTLPVFNPRYKAECQDGSVFFFSFFFFPFQDSRLAHTSNIGLSHRCTWRSASSTGLLRGGGSFKLDTRYGAKWDHSYARSRERIAASTLSTGISRYKSRGLQCIFVMQNTSVNTGPASALRWTITE